MMYLSDQVILSVLRNSSKVSLLTCMPRISERFKELCDLDEVWTCRKSRGIISQREDGQLAVRFLSGKCLCCFEFPGPVCQNCRDTVLTQPEVTQMFGINFKLMMQKIRPISPLRKKISNRYFPGWFLIQEVVMAIQINNIRKRPDLIIARNLHKREELDHKRRTVALLSSIRQYEIKTFDPDYRRNLLMRHHVAADLVEWNATDDPLAYCLDMCVLLNVKRNLTSLVRSAYGEHFYYDTFYEYDRIISRTLATSGDFLLALDNISYTFSRKFPDVKFVYR